MAEIGVMNANYSQISTIDFFLIQPTDSTSAAVPLTLIKAPRELITALDNSFVGLVKFEDNNGWIVAGPAGKTPVPEWDRLVSYAEDQAKTMPAATFYAKVDDAQAFGTYMRENPILRSLLPGKLPTGLLMNQTQSIESIEVRGSPSGDKTRAVVILKAKAGTMLYTLFSQRMPVSPPNEHHHISVKGAQSYGYCLFNPEVMSEYLQYLSHKMKDGKSDMAKSLANEAVSMQQAWGYMAIVRMPEENGYRLFLRGKWDKDEAAQLVESTNFLCTRAQKAAHPAGPSSQIKDAFWIDQIPVYKILPEQSHADNTTGKSIFFALKEEGMAMAPSAESITDFIQSMGTETAETTLGDAFTPYPTVFTQWKVDADTLMESASLGAWAPARKSGYIYGACQLIKGQAALTLDIPTAFFDNMAKFIKEQSQKTTDDKDTATAHPARK
jgi:hypothetical protein